MAVVNSLEIHHVSTSGGDCTAIVVRWAESANDNAEKVAKVLVDAGGETADDGHLAIARYLAKEIQGLKDGPWDLVIASHYHADHIAGFQRCGIDFLRLVDVGGYAIGNDTWTGVNPLGNLAGDSAVLSAYSVHVTKIFEKGGRSRVELPFMKAANFDSQGYLTQGAGPVTIEIVQGLPVTLTVYAAGGVLADGTNVLRDNVRRRVLRKNKLDENNPGLSDQSMNQLEDEVDVAFKKVSPNDSSIAFVLEWNRNGDRFRYFSAGDLSGDLSLTRYANVEEPLMWYLEGLGVLASPMDVMKATHHGSNHNNYPSEVWRKADWSLASGTEDDDQGPEGTEGLVRFGSRDESGLLDELKPETIIVPCNQMKCVPGSEYVGRVRSYCSFPQQGRALTVNFINRCDYPTPDSTLFDKRQKAKWDDFDNLRAAVADTELVDDDWVEGISNGVPTVAVVHVPPLPRDAVTADDVTIIWKTSHSLKLDYGALAGSDASLTKKSQGQQLRPLSSDLMQRLTEQLNDRAQEVFDLAASDMAYVRQHFPALVTGTAPRATLRYATQGDVLTKITGLVSTAYPPPTSGLVYTPQNTRLSAYERTTVYSLQCNTPDASDPSTSVVGTREFDQQLLDYWKSHGTNQVQTAYGGIPPRISPPRKKQKPDRYGT